MAATVLLVEDERKLRDLVRSYLERAGFTVLSTGSGAEALTLAASAAPDLVVLDLGLPDVPGRDRSARAARGRQPRPILMLTAKSTEEDRIAGLELGADDYVTKPFSPRELVLRVQAILRRGAPAAGQGVTSYGDGRAGHRRAAAPVTVRGADGRAHPDGVGHPGRAGDRAGPGVLAVRADQPGPRLRVRGLRAHRRLARQEPAPKIEADPGNPEIVQTVLGGGYRLGLARDD